MNIRLVPVSLAAVCCLLGLTACVGPIGGDTAFPQTDTSTWPEGSFPNTENLSKVAPGMTKHQLYELIGPPHFHESVFRVRVWNYLFHFRTANGIANCQYQVQFDEKSRVVSSTWEDQACEKYSGARTGAVDKNATRPLTLNDLD